MSFINLILIQKLLLCLVSPCLVHVQLSVARWQVNELMQPSHGTMRWWLEVIHSVLALHFRDGGDNSERQLRISYCKSNVTHKNG